MNVFALDVSTSIIGLCILDNKKNILLLDHIDLKKEKDFWKKCDKARIEIVKISKKYKIDAVAIEESLSKFSRGKSSAGTLILLARFNAVISYICREILNLDPIYIGASDARRLCGIKIQQTQKCGKTAKEQTFEHMSANDLQHIKWPLKKTSTNSNFRPKDFCFDRVDAFVIASAYLIQCSNKIKKSS